MTFIQKNLYNEDRKLIRNFRDGNFGSHVDLIFFSGASDVLGFPDDYAFTISALLDLYEATADLNWLQWVPFPFLFSLLPALFSFLPSLFSLLFLSFRDYLPSLSSLFSLLPSSFFLLP